jgi:hypothetical protein
LPFNAGQRVTATNLNNATLITRTVLGATQSSVALSGISQLYTNLQLVISARSDGTTTTGYDSASLQFNGVSSANYLWNSYFTTQGAASVSVAGGTGATSAQCAEIWNSHFATQGRGIAVITIPNYADLNNLKGFSGQSTATDGGTVSITQMYTGMLGAALTAAVTSITILMSTGNFLTDSTFSLYGL